MLAIGRGCLVAWLCLGRLPMAWGAADPPQPPMITTPAPPRTATLERPAADSSQSAPEEPYDRVVADEAAGSIQHALWALSAGFFIHGTGLYLGGEKKLALTLLAIEAAGLVLWMAGYLGDSLSHGSAQLAPFTRPVQALGIATFIATWQLDLLGTFNGNAGTPRYQPVPADPITGFTYYTLWSDPRQGHLNLFSLGLRLPMIRASRWLNRFDLGLQGSWDPFSSSKPLTTGALLRTRLLGGAEELASRLTLELEWFEELRADHGYGVSTAMASLEGRFNLGQSFPRFRNVVLLARWGYGLEATHYLVDSYRFSLDGEQRWVTSGEMGLLLPLARTSRIELRWRLLNDRLFSGGSVGRAPWHAGLLFQLSSVMDMLLSMNLGMGFDGWLGLAYRYY